MASRRKALRKRGVWVEPLFAEAKEWHDLRRFGLRRLEKVNSEALMIASQRQASCGLRSRRPKDARDGGGPAPTRKAIPTPDPQTSHDPGVAFFPSAYVVMLGHR